MATMSYEEARKERLEENKRRMEELGLVSLAKELKKPKVPRKTTAKPKVELHEARRSSRVAAKPVVIYKEKSRRVPGGAKSTEDARERRQRQSLRRRYLTEAARKAAIESAEAVIKNMKNPAFVKPMQHSRSSTVFWLALPAEFCQEHMSLTDEKIMLEDEKGKEWECSFIATKAGMSSGWRGFLIDHDLMDGDCCVFELLSPLRFKVHIIRFEDDNDEDDDDEEEEDESDDSDESDEGDRKKKSGSRRVKKSRRSSSGRKKSDSGDEDEDEEDEDEDEEDDEEEEFDSDVCDDHVSDEEPDEEEDSEDDYSPRLSEKVVDTLVAAPSRASRGLKRKLVKDEDDDSELGHADNSDEIKEEES